MAGVRAEEHRTGAWTLSFSTRKPPRYWNCYPVTIGPSPLTDPSCVCVHLCPRSFWIRACACACPSAVSRQLPCPHQELLNLGLLTTGPEPHNLKQGETNPEGGGRFSQPSLRVIDVSQAAWWGGQCRNLGLLEEPRGRGHPTPSESLQCLPGALACLAAHRPGRCSQGSLCDGADIAGCPGWAPQGC